MPIIDTTLYANGALRLSRHGAGKGGNVLVHVASGAQISLDDTVMAIAVAQLDECTDVQGTFNYLSAYYTGYEGAERVYNGERFKVVDHQIVRADASAAPGWHHN